ncbi:MAG: hypothetical protein PHP74_00335 [Candidatus Gracilibacteria bacterium]|nr:hypothetical protein [Candidatus Gracilibacteria bacterium]
MNRFFPEYLPEGIKQDIKETESHIKRRINAWNTARSNFSEEIVMRQLMKPLDEILQNWDEMSVEFPGKDKIERESGLAELVRRRAEVIKAQIDSMTPADMRLTLENLAKMEKYGEILSKMLMDSTDMRDPEKQKKFAWVERGLRYVMGIPGVGHSSVDANKEDIHKDIAKALENPPKHTDEPQPAFSYACTLLAFASPKQRREIVELALKGEKDPKKQKDLIKRLNEMGAVSPMEADEFLKGKFDEKELTKMGEDWENTYDFLKRAKYLTEESYGAKNMANEMFTLTNALKTFGYVAGSLTVLLNGICHWSDIKKDPMSFFKIKQVWIGAAEIGAAAIADSDKTVSEIVADKGTTESWDYKKSLDGIYSVVSASPRGWKAVLEEDGYLGVKALGEFVAKYSKNEKDLKEKDATLENFKEFLTEESRKDSKKDYGKILGKLIKIEETEKTGGMSETRFKKLAMAFSKLNIVGDGEQARKTNVERLEEAQGKETKKT